MSHLLQRGGALKGADQASLEVDPRQQVMAQSSPRFGHDQIEDEDGQRPPGEPLVFDRSHERNDSKPHLGLVHFEIYKPFLKRCVLDTPVRIEP